MRLEPCGPKTFNDNHGHDAGATVLRHVGEMMQAMFTGEAVPCRFGGEKFVVLLPGGRVAIVASSGKGSFGHNLRGGSLFPGAGLAGSAAKQTRFRG